MTNEEQEEPNFQRRASPTRWVAIDRGCPFQCWGITGVASSEDISLSGLYVSHRTEIPLGALLALRILLAADHVGAKREVVYTNPGKGVGVKFRDLSDDARKSLGQELASA